MKKFTLTALALLFFLFAKAQKQIRFLAMTEREVVNDLSNDTALVYKERTKSEDGYSYLVYEPKYDESYINLAYYFNKSKECTHIRQVFKNKYFSEVIKKLNNNKSYKASDDYSWINKSENKYIKIEFMDKTPFFSVQFGLLSE